MDELINCIEKLDLCKSQRGGNILIYRNYEHKLDYVAKTTNKHSWRCNSNSDCKARVYTIGLNPPVTEGDVWHEHPAKPAKIEIRKAFSDIKSNNSSEARSAIQKAQVSLSIEAQVMLPTYDALRQRLQSKVDPYSKYPKINKKEDLLIPDEFKFT
ncbi:unnamed protein product, partial [Brachionus calyciflorus]